MPNIFHALVLGLHQPAGNLEALLDSNEWEAREILYALDRIPRSLWGYEDVGRLHLSLSGTLLETLSHPDFQRRVHGIVKCGELLWHIQNESVIRILGTGYYHPVLPLTPPADWDEQLRRWRGIASHLCWRDYFPGFWPPEIGFCMEMIPHLKRMGYRYVIVDSEHVESLTPMPWEELRYRPHLARFGGEEIIVIVRDRELSNAQESGMEPSWFMHEVHERTKHCTFPPLVTTCTDGENGGWFRNTSAQGNFWGALYLPLLEMARRGQTEIRPVFIEDYLSEHGAHGVVNVRSGAWNTGWHSGTGFSQWTGSQAQRDSLKRVAEASRTFHEKRLKAGSPSENPELHARLEDARWRILRAQTSCNFYWGEAWLPRCHRDLDDAWNILNRISL
jgi:alpha-amylase/alpha-mannosidase (GH57 family)